MRAFSGRRESAAVSEPMRAAIERPSADVATESPARAVIGRAVVTVVGFWWVATGLIIALQRSAPTKAGGLIAASLLAVYGGYLMHAHRNDLTARGAQWSFLGGAFFFAYVSVAFYGGWIIGIKPTVAFPPAPNAETALHAIVSTIYSDVLALLLIAVALRITRGGENRTGVWALFCFWSMQQIAKLAVFFGVENPGGNFLPSHLAYLQRFFGPPHNSPLLYASIAAVAVMAAWLTWRSHRARSAWARQAFAMHALLVGLTVLELAVLGVRLDATMWDSFLKIRGG
jgi:putative photosynthetic complex assembly protein 2